MAAADRLKRNREFSRVYRQGSYQGGKWLGLHTYKRRGISAREGPRVGFAVSRVIRGAVHRNRAKRLVRESFRQSGVRMEAGYDLIVTAKWPLNQEPAFHSLQAEMDRLLVKAGAGRLEVRGEGSAQDKHGHEG